VAFVILQGKGLPRKATPPLRLGLPQPTSLRLEKKNAEVEKTLSRQSCSFRSELTEIRKLSLQMLVSLILEINCAAPLSKVVSEGQFIKAIILVLHQRWHWRRLSK